MSQKTLIFSVEGQSEEFFVKGTLAPYFQQSGIHCRTIKLGEARSQRTGGIKGIMDCVMELRKIRHNPSFRNVVITTMYDFADINWEKEGLLFEKGSSIQMKAEKAANLLKSQTGFPDRFIPYFQMHQFESLLFSNPAVIQEIFQGKETAIEKLIAVKHEFGNNPEAINSNNKPSYRIEEALDIATKSFKGKTLANLVGKIGLESLRSHCHHFNHWITQLEQIA